MKLIALAFFLLLPLAASVNAQTQGSEPALTANPVFHKECAKCHGKTATGRHFGGPSLVSTKVAGTSQDDLRNIIENGHKRMPKFGGKLPPSEIDTLVEEINALNHK